MSKILALEWDDREIRAVLASPQGSDLFVEQIQRLPVTSRSGEAVPTTRDIAATLSAAVSEHGWKKLRTLVAVGRSSCELKELSLPPVPDDELPDLVRFQAMREFNNLSEESPFDYISVPGDADQARTVLAAALAPATYKAIREIVSTAGLQLDQIVLRPCAAATLVNDRLPETFQVRLFVDVLTSELDLTVLAGTTPELMRTARLGGEHSGTDAQRTILNEIRRTLAAASNSLHGRRIDKIVLCGDGPYQTQLAELLERELKLRIELFDPLDRMTLGPKVRDNLPPEHSHFAPHLGLLLGATGNRAPLLDFEHPHRKPEVPDQTRTYTLAFALAAVVVVAAGYWIMSGLWELDEKILAASTQIKSLSGLKQSQDINNKQISEIDTWLASDLPVVQELRAISDKLPDAKQLVVRKIQYTADKNGGNFTLTGNAVNNAAITDLVKKLNELNEPTNTQAATPQKVTPPKAPEDKSTTESKTETKDSPVVTAKPPAMAGKTPPVPAATSSPANKLPVKQYRIVLGGAEEDRKNAKYPYTYTIKVYVDNPTPLMTVLGPPPTEKNPRFFGPRLPPKPALAQPQQPTTPAKTTPVEAPATEVEL